MVTRGVFYSVLSLMEVLLWSVNLAERTDFCILAWFFLQDGLQRSRTGSVDFTDGGGKFLCSLRALFGLVEENSSISASSSCVLKNISDKMTCCCCSVTDVFIHPRVPLVVVRHPDWSEQGTAWAVPDS